MELRVLVTYLCKIKKNKKKCLRRNSYFPIVIIANTIECINVDLFGCVAKKKSKLRTQRQRESNL